MKLATSYLTSIYARKLLSASAYEAAGQAISAYSAAIGGRLLEHGGFDRVHAQLIGIALTHAVAALAAENGEREPYCDMPLNEYLPYPTTDVPEDEDEIEAWALMLLDQLRSIENASVTTVSKALENEKFRKVMNDLQVVSCNEINRLSRERVSELFNLARAIRDGNYWNNRAKWTCQRCGCDVSVEIIDISESEPSLARVGAVRRKTRETPFEMCPLCTAPRNFCGYNIAYLHQYK